jgi:hypothetical protein
LGWVALRGAFGELILLRARRFVRVSDSVEFSSGIERRWVGDGRRMSFGKSDGGAAIYFFRKGARIVVLPTVR